MSGAGFLEDLDQQIISNTKYWQQTDPNALYHTASDLYILIFNQALVEVIREHHQRHNLLDILTEVTKRVVDHQNRYRRYPVQVPAPVHTLTRHLYLWADCENWETIFSMHCIYFLTLTYWRKRHLWKLTGLLTAKESVLVVRFWIIVLYICYDK